MIEFLTLSEPPIDKREILRYASAKECDEISCLLDECIEESRGVLNFNIKYCELKFIINGDVCDFGDFSVKSASLADNLSSAGRVFLFVASCGHGIDRLVMKYSHLSSAKALLFSAIGTERVEALADEFCEYLQDKTSMTLLPRFSAGYGDLPLSLQEDIFKVLSPEKQMGVYLSENLIMSPLKTVTAFVGLK